MGAPVFSPATVPVTQYIAGRWYSTATTVGAGGLAAATDLVRLYPFFLRAPITVSDLGTRVITVGLGSFQLAIYANNPTTMRPTGTVLARTAGILSTVADVVEADITGANVSLAAGMYWGATNVDATSATAIFQTTGASLATSSGLMGATTMAFATSGSNATNWSLTTPMAYDTWSTMTGATFTEVSGLTGAAHIFLKAA